MRFQQLHGPIGEAPASTLYAFNRFSAPSVIQTLGAVSDTIRLVTFIHFSSEMMGYRPTAPSPPHSPRGIRMVLSKVEYEFFEHDDVSKAIQEIDRQIRLTFTDYPTLYISWTWERPSHHDSPAYSIAYGESSFFTTTEAALLDVSQTAIWSRHIGRAVELIYLASASRELAHQVLELRTGIDCTYLYSLGRDCVMISDASPLGQHSKQSD
jgi:hypothetical protein